MEHLIKAMTANELIQLIALHTKPEHKDKLIGTTPISQFELAYARSRLATLNRIAFDRRDLSDLIKSDGLRNDFEKL